MELLTYQGSGGWAKKQERKLKTAPYKIQEASCNSALLPGSSTPDEGKKNYERLKKSRKDFLKTSKFDPLALSPKIVRKWVRSKSDPNIFNTNFFG